MGLYATKPVFGVSNKARLKLVSSATETIAGNLLVASSDVILSIKRITKALICVDAQSGLHLCCLQTPENRFSRFEAHIKVG